MYYLTILIRMAVQKVKKKIKYGISYTGIDVNSLSFLDIKLSA